MDFKDHLYVDNSQIYITCMKYGSPIKTSIWISTKHLQYCMILDFYSKPVSPMDFSASVNDTSFFQAAEIKNLGVIFNSYFSLHPVNLQTYFESMCYFPSSPPPPPLPHPTSFSFHMMLQPHWLSFYS